MSGESLKRAAGADELVDELVPEELDWRDLVVSYPKTSLALAALGGYLLGRSRGETLLLGLGAFAADTLTSKVNDLLGEEVL
jgi:hypothetical protein